MRGRNDINTFGDLLMRLQTLRRAPGVDAPALKLHLGLVEDFLRRHEEDLRLLDQGLKPRRAPGRPKKNQTQGESA